MINVAVVGFGWWGRHIVSRLKDNAHLNVVLVVENQIGLHPEIAELEMDVAQNLEDALNNDSIDAVILTTPHMVHEEQVLACARAGKHVFCEKPLAMNADSARRSVFRLYSDKCRIGNWARAQV